MTPARAIALSIALLSPAAHCVADAPASSHYVQTLWLDGSHERALFVPEGTLQEAEIDKLPISEGAREILKRQVEKFKREQNDYCDSPSTTAEQGVLQETFTFEEILASNEIVLVGIVEDIVHGWSPWTNRISHVAYMRVDEIVMGSTVDDAPTVGDTVAVLFEGGRTLVAGTLICGKPIEGLYTPALEDKVLLSGDAWPSDPRFFNARARFPIVGGELVAQPYKNLRKDQLSRPLTTVREELRADVENSQ